MTSTGTTSTGGKAHGPLPPLLLLLTVVTGVVDAVSILKLGRVFVANMTGNVVFTGFALVGAPGFSLSASLAALLALAMGIQNAVVRRLAVPDLTTTVLTMTLTASPPTCGPRTTGGPGSADASSRSPRCSPEAPAARCSSCTPGPRPPWASRSACWPS